MRGVAIRVTGLGKQYTIGARKAACHTFRERLTDVFSRPFRSAWWKSRYGALVQQESMVWALKDVSFEVAQGEMLGVIGRNGAGKSTLLKILSRITEPTEGYAEIEGRVGSLLEVGTGFHSELTGQENIYLNGAILGMKKSEIDRKFDEIVAFAETEKFLDTPVKHYSSGMYMRLAFAVAAHLDPEVLLVDEVLAVGDVTFQRKCLGKMGEVAKAGRTVLFVSHNMTAILNLCNRVLLLDGGRLYASGKAREVVEQYLNGSVPLEGEVLLHDRQHSGREIELAFLAVRVRDGDGHPAAYVDLNRGCTIEIDYAIHRPVTGAQLAFELWNGVGICVLSTTDLDLQPEDLRSVRLAGRYRASCRLEPDLLRPGRYWIDLGSSVPNVRMLDEARHAISFEVVDTGSVEYKLAQGRKGVIAPGLKWQTTRLSGEALW